MQGANHPVLLHFSFRTKSLSEREKMGIYAVQVENGKAGENGEPSVSPVYRSILAKDGFPPPKANMSTSWEVFRTTTEKYPGNKMLGWREFTNGNAGPYLWKTYKEIYEEVLKVGSTLKQLGVEPDTRIGVYGVNCPQWACNGYGLICVPLYDTLGAGAVDYIIEHAEIEFVFVQDKKVKQEVPGNLKLEGLLFVFLVVEDLEAMSDSELPMKEGEDGREDTFSSHSDNVEPMLDTEMPIEREEDTQISHRMDVGGEDVNVEGNEEDEEHQEDPDFRESDEELEDREEHQMEDLFWSAPDRDAYESELRAWLGREMDGRGQDLSYQGQIMAILNYYRACLNPVTVLVSKGRRKLGSHSLMRKQTCMVKFC
ncbi:hypothetical protein J5N97_028735 [Dioscorea zingiberensis]|uniref:AMP-dependent synthetase/ligase domain-containing protein n=1 Tax=Dioscorea zingiberensis TaxID=325984 RepID=A0A9D5BZI5_9LILI|nr:hypothetical protein J5N97_028735 [Dioscorea zingiberensis]